MLSESAHAAKIKALKEQVVKAVDGKNFEKAEEINAKINELTEKAKNSTKVLKNEGIEIVFISDLISFSYICIVRQF